MKNPYTTALSAPSLVPRPLPSLLPPLGMRLATLLLSMVLHTLLLHYGYKCSYHENMLACYCFLSLSTRICSGCGFLPLACCTLCYILWLLKCLKDNWLWWSGLFWYSVRLVAQKHFINKFGVTRDTHCADLAPQTSTFAVCLVFPKLCFLRSHSMCPGNQTSLTK